MPKFHLLSSCPFPFKIVPTIYCGAVRNYRREKLVSIPNPPGGGYGLIVYLCLRLMFFAPVCPPLSPTVNFAFKWVSASQSNQLYGVVVFNNPVNIYRERPKYVIAEDAMIPNNAIDIYKHYNVPIPTIDVPDEEVDKALTDIAKIGGKYKFYANKLKEYLKIKKTTLRKYIIKNMYKDMLKTMQISDGHWADGFYRNIHLMLCNKYRLSPLALELSIISDIQYRDDKYDTNALHRGIPEPYVGIVPYDLLWGGSKESIELNYQVKKDMVFEIKKFLNHYRSCNKEKCKSELSTTTLISIWKTLRKLILEMNINSFSEYNGERWANIIREYFEKERQRVTKNGTITYHYKSKNRELGYICTFFDTMWQELGMSVNPIKVENPADLSLRGQKRTIIQSIRLVKDKSEYFNRTTVNNQVMVGIGPNKQVPAVLEEEELLNISQYIRNRCFSIENGLEPKWEKMDIRHMMQYHNLIQSDHILTFSVVSGARPLDLTCACETDVGEYSTNIFDPINDRFRNEMTTIEPPIEESQFKKRLPKPFYGPVFTIFAHLMKIRKHICKIQNRELLPCKNANMREKGIPMYMSRLYRRASYCTILDQFRAALMRVGIDSAKAARSTIYFSRKAMFNFSHKWGMSEQSISDYTGTDVRTARKYYLYKEFRNNANRTHAIYYVDRIGLKPEELKLDGPIVDKQPIAEEGPFNEFKSLSMRPTGSINEKDLCSISGAEQILEGSKLSFTKKMLLNTLSMKLIRGQKKSNRWCFSKSSIESFGDRYIDTHGFIRMYKKARGKRITKRRALQIMNGYLKKYAVTIGNKCFTVKSGLVEYLTRP